VFSFELTLSKDTTLSSIVEVDSPQYPGCKLLASCFLNRFLLGFHSTFARNSCINLHVSKEEQARIKKARMGKMVALAVPVPASVMPPIPVWDAAGIVYNRVW
jgi:hypothetical protein